MDRMGGLGPEHVAELARSAARTRPQPTAVFFDVGGVLASDGLPSHGVEQMLAEASIDADPVAVTAAGKELWNKVKVGSPPSVRSSPARALSPLSLCGSR